MKKQNYYLGLDIGTDSVGYAVADEEYRLLKRKGEYMWGVHTFDAADGSAERRGFRTSRRRLNRRQSRVRIIQELFAKEVTKVDPHFFIRIRESALYREDKSKGVGSYSLFNDVGYNDSHYYSNYPTIHHLIQALINDEKPHDVREVCLACIWLVAHRGHFLLDMSKDNIDPSAGFISAYNALVTWFDLNGYDRPWRDVNPVEVLEILNKRQGIKAKSKLFANLLFGGKIPKGSARKSEGEDVLMARPFAENIIISLLVGGKIKDAGKLFLTLSDVEDVTLDLGQDDAVFADNVARLGDDGELLVLLRAVKDAAALTDLLSDTKSISEKKVRDYERHKKDLRNLKDFIRKYLPKKYSEVFRIANNKIKNYVAYSSNYKGVKGKCAHNGASSEEFCDYIRKLIKDVVVEECDRPLYDDMMERLSLYTFMPKQVTGENRIIPYQLYWRELVDILNRASTYLSFLNDVSDGLSTKDKIIATFEYRIPYFVGPLHDGGQSAFWLERREVGRITPWNIEEKVDYEKTEQAFIEKLVGHCTYIPGELALPKSSLLYTKFIVLNTINKIKIDDVPIIVSLKQRIYEELFMRYRKVSKKKITEFLISCGVATKQSVIGGIDELATLSLSSYLDFRPLISSGVLSYDDAEDIIEHLSCVEDKRRFKMWLRRSYPRLTEDDILAISSKNYKDFGRLSRRFLEDIYGTERGGSGEAHTIIDMLYNTNLNLMELLSDKYTFMETVAEERKAYFSDMTLSERLDEMYISGAVKRPIIRTLDIVSEVVKVMGHPPTRIFVEMARGEEKGEKKGRTQSRKEQIIELYDKTKDEEVPKLLRELEAMGELADSKLRSDRLFLYFMQFGKCMYSGKPIELSSLMNDKLYDIDHIYPQHFVKDDSVINNKVLVLSVENGAKGDKYPISRDVQDRMRGFWKKLFDIGTISEEKYKRLIRNHGFIDEERWNFIARQMVETRQSTKAVKEILESKYGSSGCDVVCVKAGLVSDFRHIYDIHKSRMLNDLHHARDAYLNIVVGNVYDNKFSRAWFRLTDNYSMKTEKIFEYPVKTPNGKVVWQGKDYINNIRRYCLNNHVRVSRYTYCKSGGFFDQMPKHDGVVPRKTGLDAEKYGGYQKTSASFFVLVKYTGKKGSDAIIMPVEVMYAGRFLNDEAFRRDYTAKMVSEIRGELVSNIEYPLGLRVIKINTVLDCDGYRAYISGKANSGKIITLTNAIQFYADVYKTEYIRKVEKAFEKIKSNPAIVLDAEHLGIAADKNLMLYDYYVEKLSTYPYDKRPANPKEILKSGKNRFVSLSILEQIKCLVEIHKLFIRVASVSNLESIGGKASAGTVTLSSTLSNWAKSYRVVRLVDISPTGLFENTSKNLLDLI